MSAMTLVLRDSTRSQRFEDVTSFVGEDRSGSFGLLPNHDRFMTSLELGLCRFQSGGREWTYVATVGALIYFHENRLELNTRHYLVDRDYSRISAALERQLLEEENRLREQKQGLRQMEEEVLKRLWQLGRNEAFGRDEIF